jgi:hypothetical protein
VPKGRGVDDLSQLPQRRGERIRHLTLPPAGTSLYQKGRVLTHDKRISSHYFSVCFDWLCQLIASTFKWRSESWRESDFSQNNLISRYSAKAFFFVHYYPRLKSRGN